MANHRAAAPAAEEDDDFRRTGRVTFDDRGNASWEWSLGNGDFGTEITSTRLKKLQDPSLAIAPEEPPRSNDAHQHYEGGGLRNAEKRRKPKDLRRLGEWIKLKKQLEAQKKTSNTEKD